MLIKDVVAKLLTQDQNSQCELVVCKSDGEVIIIDVTQQAQNMKTVLGMFGKNKSPAKGILEK